MSWERSARRAAHKGGLAGIPGADQYCRIINKDGGTFGLEAEGAFEILLCLGYVAVIKFELSRDKVGGGA